MCFLAPSISSVATPTIRYKNPDLGLLNPRFLKNRNTNVISTTFPVESCAKSKDQMFDSIKFHQGNPCNLRDLRTWASTAGPVIEFSGDQE